MHKYNFDHIIDRHGSQCKKIENLQRNFGRTDLLPLWIADMDFAVCPEITDAIVKRIGQHPIYGYTPTYDSFWQAIIDWQRERNNFVFTRDEVTFAPGGVTAFGMAINFFTRPGDKIVIQPPVYYDFKESILGNGRVPVDNPLLPTDDNFFRMDLDGLEQIFVNEKPRMMVVCNPQNPIGIVWPKDVLQQVAQLARKHDVLIFADEVFSDLTLFGHHHTPVATACSDAADITITCGAPGKAFNIAGFKSTWMVVKNPKLREPFFRWIDANELANSNIVALLATETAYRYGAPWLAECIEYLEDNINYVDRFCREHLPGINAIRPQATFLMWLDCTALGMSHNQLMSFFTDKARLALNEGSMYGEPGLCHMRLNIGCPRAVLQDAMQRLQNALQSLPVGSKN